VDLFLLAHVEMNRLGCVWVVCVCVCVSECECVCKYREDLVLELVAVVTIYSSVCGEEASLGQSFA